MKPKSIQIASIALIFILLAACEGSPKSTPTPVPTLTPLPTPTPIPTLTLSQTSSKEFVITDFDAVHSAVDGDPNQYLILGNLPIAKPAADLPPELAVFPGRWEGASYDQQIKQEFKLVLAIQEITAQEGKATGWWASNLQYPDQVEETHFRVLQSNPPSIDFEYLDPGGYYAIATFSYDHDRDLLVGWIKYPSDNYTYGPFELSHNRSYSVYKEDGYAQYLASKRISARVYQDEDLRQYGDGYLLYLPEGYEGNPDKTWPLIFFLHGLGDCGDFINRLATDSPFMYIREKGSLPFIIVAPLLRTSQNMFPLEYMDGVLAEAQATHRVDPKRIYVTGLSLGGEATYRFAIQNPDTFAAIAPLSAFVGSDTLSKIGLIKDLPVWAIHGAQDTGIPVATGQQPVDALKTAGGNVQFTVLAGHDHNTWTTTYSDPAFYNWFLQFQKP